MGIDSITIDNRVVMIYGMAFALTTFLLIIILFILLGVGFMEFAPDFNGNTYEQVDSTQETIQSYSQFYQ